MPEGITLQNPPAEPMALFAAWLEDAQSSPEIRYAAATCLSTVDPDGLPDGRIVLLKKLEDDGFVFFTDAGSPKARALERQPEAALTFYWGPLERQVRIRGRVETAGDRVSDECFEHRPRRSRLTTWASSQSQPRGGRQDLEERYERVRERFEGTEEVPRPDRWRAYRLVPHSVELWQARACRLHDRLLYRRTAEGWERTWLDP